MERFALDISAPPIRPTKRGWSEIRYAPNRLGPWVAEAASVTDGARNRKSDY